MNGIWGVIIFAVIEIIVAIGVVFFILYKQKSVMQNLKLRLTGVLQNYETCHQEIKALVEGLVPFSTLKEEVNNLKLLKIDFIQQTGRVSIATSELEVINTRAGELNEIEKELEASLKESEGEFNLINQKYEELKEKNEALSARIHETTGDIEKKLKILELNDEIKEEIIASAGSLESFCLQINLLLKQIELEKNQYFILKRRFDALDIEYAQLYEKYMNK